MRVVRYPLARIAWDDVAPLIGNSFFGSPGFANLWRTLGGKPVYWLVEQGGQILAVLPGVEFGIKPLKRFYAMPAGCYARLFHSPIDSVDENEVANRFVKALLEAGYMKLYVYDYYGCFQAPPRLEVLQCQTTLVDISVSGWEPPDRKIRSEIRKATRERILIEQFSPDKHLSRFLSLMESTERRHGHRPKYPPAFFKELARLTEDDHRVHWLWCEHDGKAAASQIYFIENDMVIGWQAYYDKAFSFLKPNQYMLFATARKLALQGVRRLSLGASPDDALGLIRYKEKWGGKPYSYNRYFHKSVLGKLV